MLLMVEKGIRGGIWQSIYQYAKANNKHMKDYDRSKGWDISYLYGWAMSQKLLVNNFELTKDISQFNKIS